MSGRYERKKPQKAGGLKKTVLIVVLVIVILIAALVVAAVVYYNSMLKKLNQVQVPTINYADLATEPTETTAAATEATAATVETTVAATEPHVASSADYINILLVGQASREGEAERFADTMILCTVNTRKDRHPDLPASGHAGAVSQLYGHQRKESQRRQDQAHQHLPQRLYLHQQHGGCYGPDEPDAVQELRY